MAYKTKFYLQSAHSTTGTRKWYYFTGKDYQGLLYLSFKFSVPFFVSIGILFAPLEVKFFEEHYLFLFIA